MYQILIKRDQDDIKIFLNTCWKTENAEKRMVKHDTRQTQGVSQLDV